MKKKLIAATLAFGAFAAHADNSNVTLIVNSDSTMTQGMTMVLATHEMGFATQVADQVCFLESGLILERGTPEEVLRAPSNPKTKEFLKRVHEAGRL